VVLWGLLDSSFNYFKPEAVSGLEDRDLIKHPIAEQDLGRGRPLAVIGTKGTVARGSPCLSLGQEIGVFGQSVLRIDRYRLTLVS
jgi:hypothetical protein